MAQPVEEVFLTPREQRSNFGFAVWHSRPRRMETCHQHDDVELNHVTTGTYTYLHGGSLVTLRAGDLAVFWAGRPHQVVSVSEDAFFHGASVPLGWFLSWKLPIALTQPVLCGDFLTQRVEDAERQVAWNWGHWLDDMRHDTPERRRVLLLEMEALLMRMALARNGDNGAVADVPRTPGKGSMTHLNRVGQIATYIGTHYAEPLTTAQIADAVGLHPNYAVTLFRKLTGTTIIDFLTKQRLSHAQLLLATTQMNVLDIAMESGFGSASRFYAVFKDAFQMSPRQYREMIRTARHVSEAHYAGTRRSRSRSSGRAGRAKG